MDRLLARLERRFGRYAFEHLSGVIAGGMAIIAVLGLLRPGFVEQLVLVPELVSHQPWRLVTFLFVPPAQSFIWMIFAVYVVWIVASSLESTWGAFKFNVFYFLGAAMTVAVSLVFGFIVDNEWLNMSLFLAFATVYPDFEFLLFFILPVKVKWLAVLDVAWLLWALYQGDLGTKAAIGAAMANYLLFFGAHLSAMLRGRRIEAGQRARRTSFHAPPPKASGRACAICGKREEDGADIRVCTCERCGGPRNLCLEHARNH